MQKFFRLWAAEPAVIIGVVRALLVAAVGFGLDMSAEQITSLVLAVEAIGALVTRQSVFAPATVQRLVEETTSTLGDTVTDTVGDLTGRHRRAEDVELPEVEGGPGKPVPPVPPSAYPASAVELLSDDDSK